MKISFSLVFNKFVNDPVLRENFTAASPTPNGSACRPPDWPRAAWSPITAATFDPKAIQVAAQPTALLVHAWSFGMDWVQSSSTPLLQPKGHEGGQPRLSNFRERAGAAKRTDPKSCGVKSEGPHIARQTACEQRTDPCHPPVGDDLAFHYSLLCSLGFPRRHVPSREFLRQAGEENKVDKYVVSQKSITRIIWKMLKK